MSEFYVAHLINSGIVFDKCPDTLPPWLLTLKFSPTAGETNIALTTRMGDPSQLHCAVYREENKPGGFFSFFYEADFLFAVKALTNLEFAASLGFFGEMTANARYGADIFENMELPDD